MNNLYKILILCAIVQFVAGCQKYFNFRPNSTSVNPTTVRDFMEVMNTDSNAICEFSITDVMSDDDSIVPATITQRSSYYTRAYTWDKDIWTGGDADFMYNSAYNRILQMNVILQRIDDAKLDSFTVESDRMVVKAQAFINRAWFYLQLANLYGPAYSKSSASADACVPLVLSPDATSRPSRSSVAVVYNQILSDLHQAVATAALPAMGADLIHPGKAAGFALLARTYLYRGQYDSCRMYTDSALSLRSTLQDYNVEHTIVTQLQDMASNPEILMGKMGLNKEYYSSVTLSFQAPADLFNTLTGSDIRRVKAFGYGDTYYTVGSSPVKLVFDYSVSVPEVILTKAECLARSGDAGAAASLLDTLRKNRIYSWDYSPIEYNSANIVSVVLEERRRELLYHGGLRFFDLKRLNKEGTYTKTLTRFGENGQVIATLSPSSPNYLMQFSPIIIGNNSNIIQNPRQ